jgi:hypothetical protein
MMELYIHSPVYLHGIVLNYVIKCRNNFPLFYFFCSIVNLRLSSLSRESCGMYLEMAALSIAAFDFRGTAMMAMIIFT